MEEMAGAKAGVWEELHSPGECVCAGWEMKEGGRANKGFLNAEGRSLDLVPGVWEPLKGLEQSGVCQLWD